MADQLPAQPEEREQGAVQEQEIQAQMNPVEAQPLIAPVPINGNAPVAQDAQQPQAEQRASTPWIIPHNYDNVRGRAKQQSERARDAGLIWQVLAASSTSATIRSIAKALIREE